MSTAIMVVVVMTGIGIVFGFVLALTDKKFAMEVNPLIELVEDELPKGQCGGCGYAGCRAYAEAVVLDKDVPPNLCVPGKEAVATAVAKLTGKAAAKVEQKYAHVRCAGNLDNAARKYKYEGIKDCVAANLLQNGPKECQYGCIGLGTCVNNCPFGALTLGDNGLPIVNTKKCTGCGKCESVCPKNVITLLPTKAHVCVECNSHDKGAAVRKACKVGCLGCGLCARNCEYGAIKVENALAVVDTHVCIEKCSEATCLAKCPTKAIQSIIGDLGIETKTKQEIAANVSKN
ncbi:Fe-S cluster domain-containing protein [Clostridium fermenticellae]|uniref:Ion-translocating oxidoreductase complex subunit B n=1 Tax=Clostridium fermenticellae TaxID=2068654 RepID=A0A386H4K6_9CLOT|nr:Fe-S cluster domain-containing protein [Clostridium fermenticellae]AYD40564.1 Fe-S cluster domain-containing protein [Clostridium fermenticellae]